jgi:hypothetical protein
MGKNKPRHNPDKPQNEMGTWCGWAEHIPRGDGTFIIHCERGYDELTKFCKGNPHLCKKARYQNLAQRSDRRKNIDNSY